MSYKQQINLQAMDPIIKPNMPSKQEVIDAYERIQPYVHRTPILSNQTINQMIGADVLFKCQNFQKTGSFKVRGVANAMLQVKGLAKICCHSSGNHAQAVAYMAQKVQRKAFIVMPEVTSEVKKKAVRGYGAEIVECGPSQKDQQSTSERVSKQQKAIIIHPYNDYNVIIGQSTCAYQLYQDHQNIDYLLVPVGGGGLCSGTLITTEHFSPNTQVIGVEPVLAADAKESLEKEKIVPQYPPVTLAEGVRTSLGELTFSFLRRYIKGMILVTEEEIIEASRLLMERMKMVVELSSATVMAALLKDPRFKGKKVALILTGGNVDLSSLFKEYYSKL